MLWHGRAIPFLQEEARLLYFPGENSANEMPWTLFTMALPTSLSSSSLLVWELAHGSQYGCRPLIAIPLQS